MLRVQMCAVGRSQEVSSRVPPRTLRTVEPGLGAVQTHTPHSGQTQRVDTRPLPVVRWTPFGWPWTRRKAPSGSTQPSEKALLVIARTGGNVRHAILAQTPKMGVVDLFGQHDDRGIAADIAAAPCDFAVRVEHDAVGIGGTPANQASRA